MAEEQAEEVAAEEESIVLSQSIVTGGLKGLAKTVDGAGFALTQLEINGQKIGDIAALSNYKHLRYLNLSDNLISDLKPLDGLDYLLSINLSKNKIVDVELPAWSSCKCWTSRTTR